MMIIDQLIYLSYFMDENTPLYGGSKGIQVKPERSIINGDTANTKQIVLNNHSGTHIDFPNHFFIEGKTSELYEASEWIFNKPFLLKIGNIREDKIIDLNEDELKVIPVETDFLIIKTGFGKYRKEEKYWKNNPGLSPDLADRLRKRLMQLRVVGMDFISLTSFQNRTLGREAHKMFLGTERPILLVEDMNLLQLDESPVQLMCFPFMVIGLDGSPVTIIAKIKK